MTPYECAKAEWAKGIKEISGRKHNPRIVWYASFTTLKASDDETPWCSSFMCAMAFLAGYPSTKSASAISWMNYGIDGDGLVGDIVILKRSGGYHVAFLNKPYKKGDKTLNLLGGNQGDAVSIKDFDAENLLGIRRFPVL
jgi:uncharacterized protein (TIGR02594 family)